MDQAPGATETLRPGPERTCVFYQGSPKPAAGRPEASLDIGDLVSKTKQRNLARGRTSQPNQRANQRRLAGPIWAQEPKSRPLRHDKVDIIDSGAIPEPLDQPLRLDRSPNRGWLRLTDVETGLRPLDTTRRIY